MLLDIVLGSGSVDMYIEETENETGIFQKSLIDAIYSIRKSIHSISKALEKDNPTNVDIHSVEKEVKNMVEKGLLEKRKTWQGLDSFFILDMI